MDRAATTERRDVRAPAAGEALLLEMRACGRGCWAAFAGDAPVALCGTHARRMCRDRAGDVLIEGATRDAMGAAA